MTGKDLIDTALQMGYSKKQIASLVGVTDPYIHAIYNGRQRISPETAALLADLVGEDGADIAHRLMVAYEKDERRRTMLARVLFSSAALCVACVPLLAVNGDAMAADGSMKTVYTLCAIAMLHRLSLAGRLRA